MPERARATIILALTWMGASWFCGLVVLFDDVRASGVSALGNPRLWAGALIGGAVGAMTTPLIRAKWNRWYWGALLGLPTCICILLFFFFVFPHSWQPTRAETWKSTLTLLGVYIDILVPVSLMAGAVSTWWVRKTSPTQSPAG